MYLSIVFIAFLHEYFCAVLQFFYAVSKLKQYCRCVPRAACVDRCMLQQARQNHKKCSAAKNAYHGISFPYVEQHCCTCCAKRGNAPRLCCNAHIFKAVHHENCYDHWRNIFSTKRMIRGGSLCENSANGNARVAKMMSAQMAVAASAEESASGSFIFQPRVLARLFWQLFFHVQQHC